MDVGDSWILNEPFLLVIQYSKNLLCGGEDSHYSWRLFHEPKVVGYHWRPMLWTIIDAGSDCSLPRESIIAQNITFAESAKDTVSDDFVIANAWKTSVNE